MSNFVKSLTQKKKSKKLFISRKYFSLFSLNRTLFFSNRRWQKAITVKEKEKKEKFSSHLDRKGKFFASSSIIKRFLSTSTKKKLLPVCSIHSLYFLFHCGKIHGATTTFAFEICEIKKKNIFLSSIHHSNPSWSKERERGLNFFLC